MAYSRTYTIDAGPTGDTVKAAVATKLDGDLTNAYTYLNAHDVATTNVHGLGTAYVVGTTTAQTLTNKTISSPTITGGTIENPTLTGTVDASGATISSPTITGGTATNMTLVTPTFDSVADTLTKLGLGSSSFSAYLTADLDDCTGDSTAVEFKGAYWTENYDNGSVFSNGVFTAPATGFYLLCAQVYMSQLSSGHTYGSCELRISTGDIYYMFWGNPYGASTSGEFACLNSISIYLTSGQTANLYLFVAGGTKTVHVEGSSTQIWGYRLS